MEGLEEGLRDGGRPAGAASCLTSPWLACRLSADWKTCQVTLAPPTHPPTQQLLSSKPHPKPHRSYGSSLVVLPGLHSQVRDLARFGDPKKPASSSLSVLRAVRLITVDYDYAVTFKWLRCSDALGSSTCKGRGELPKCCMTLP